MLQIDPTAARTWIYPLHESYPLREYQLAISRTAIMHNTLVSLPTGLGKTFVAAVVMYNFHRWFERSGGIVVFCAPTRPLVSQQIKACYSIVGIPQKVTSEISGRLKPEHRKHLWATCSVFFCTPQCLQRDIEEQRCAAGRIVCVVLDEAHKARGDYAYVNVIRLIKLCGASFRVVGLSATPGIDIKSIQEVIDNIGVSKIEIRLETDPDVKKYIHGRAVEIIKVKQSDATAGIEKQLSAIISPLLDVLRRRGALGRTREGRTSAITPWCVISAKNEYHKDRNDDRSLDGHFFIVQQLVAVRSDLMVSGIGVAKSKLQRLMLQKNVGLVKKLIEGNDVSC